MFEGEEGAESAGEGFAFAGEGLPEGGDAGIYRLSWGRF